VATAKNGNTWFVINARSPAGANDAWCEKPAPGGSLCAVDHPPGDYSAPNGFYMLRVHGLTAMQLINRSGLLAMPEPDYAELARLTRQVARNNSMDRHAMTAKDEQLFAFLRQRIKHVIYVIKQNRSYDQVLGDLDVGNGNSRLAVFPEAITPNHHAIARSFVTLDNLLLSGEAHTGLNWVTAARANDYREQAHDGVTLDAYGMNRFINVGYATSEERKRQFPLSPSDPDILPGARDIEAPDGPAGEEGKGYIWDAALRAGLTVRNYGLYGDYIKEGLAEATSGRALGVPLIRNAFERNIQTSFPTKPSLMPFSDPFYPPSYRSMPDYWRYREWKREFDGFVRVGSAPNLMIVALCNDHIGLYHDAVDGVDTPEKQVADNDYAFGLLVQAVARSPFARNTLIVAIEDDPYDATDHVDAFRSMAFFAGPYVKRAAVVSKRYTTVNVVRTIEAILGIGPLGLNDAFASPMSDVFDRSLSAWSYEAVVPALLHSTQLPLAP
jgi:hypothetical protein